ncbi:MAG: hypothetical protein WBB29_02935 [Geitlerinemataceae cyanobacterium]
MTILTLHPDNAIAHHHPPSDAIDRILRCNFGKFLNTYSKFKNTD